MKPAINSNCLYLGDNGRTFCGDLRCAGMTAYDTGRDISGQKVALVTPEDVKAHEGMCVEMCGRVVPLACERCGKTAGHIANATGGATLLEPELEQLRRTT